MSRASAVAHRGNLTDVDIRSEGTRTNALKFVPAFFFILVLFVIGHFTIADPRASLIQWGLYHLSWVEVLLLLSALVGMGEQMKVSHPGVDNTMEAIVMAAFAGIQILLLTLGAAAVKGFEMFSNTEFMMVTVVSMTAAVIAILINARTLRRTIGVGDGS